MSGLLGDWERRKIFLNSWSRHVQVGLPGCGSARPILTCPSWTVQGESTADSLHKSQFFLHITRRYPDLGRRRSADIQDDSRTTGLLNSWREDSCRIVGRMTPAGRMRPASKLVIPSFSCPSFFAGRRTHAWLVLFWSIDGTVDGTYPIQRPINLYFYSVPSD